MIFPLEGNKTTIGMVIIAIIGGMDIIIRATEEGVAVDNMVVTVATTEVSKIAPLKQSTPTAGMYILYS